MKGFLKKVYTNNSACPKLSIKTRFIGFLITLIFGLALLALSSLALLGVIFGETLLFAILYSLGTITFLFRYFYIILVPFS